MEKKGQQKGKIKPIIPKPKIYSPSMAQTSSINKNSITSKSIVSRSQKLTDLQPLSDSFIQENTLPSNQINNISRLSTLPSLVSCDPSEIESLFHDKCTLLCFKCDFSNGTTSSEIALKEEALSEIYSVFLLPKCPILESIENYKSLFTLIAYHLYRTPPELPRLWLSSSDFYFETEKFHEPCWVHNTIIYDIILVFLKRPTIKFDLIVSYLGELIKLCIYLSRSIDEREQDKIQQVLLLIYSKFNKMRKFLILVLQNSLMRVLYSIDPYPSCKSTLIVLKSIVKGFKIPLKQDHELLFLYYVLPLHRCNFFSYFHNQLFQVVVQFLEKKPSLVLAVYNTLHHYWPIYNPSKQLIFLEEFGYFSSFVSEDIIPSVYSLILPRLNQCINGCHYYVSEKAISLFEINDFVWLITYQPELSYPEILPSIYFAAASHWSETIRTLSATALKALCMNNAEVFNKCGIQMRNIENDQVLKDLQKGAFWRDLIFRFSNKEYGSKEIRKLAQIFLGCESFVKKS